MLANDKQTTNEDKTFCYFSLYNIFIWYFLVALVMMIAKFTNTEYDIRIYILYAGYMNN